MEQNTVLFRNKGMYQDQSVSKSSDEFAFKNVNIRITAVNDTTQFSVTNEKLQSSIEIVKKYKGKLNKISFRDLSDDNTMWVAESEYPVGENIALVFGSPDAPQDDWRFTITSGSLQSNTVDISEGQGNPDLNYEYVYFYDSETPGYGPETEETDSYVYYINHNSAPSIPEYSDINILGKYLGKCIIGDYLVIFTHDESLDRIYRCSVIDNKIDTELIAQRDGLNFSNPIEAVGSYERDDIIKVYWVDGENPNRVINIMVDINNQPSSFDFLPDITDFPSATITKSYGGNGKFPSSVIQYFASYYNKLGQETKIVWSSDLVYASENDRGGKPDEIVNCNFTITFSNIDESFDYIRVYSAKRTSIDGPIDAHIVGDYKISGSNLTVVDNNINQESIDASVLYYIGGDSFICSTIEDKDNVLFFGDIETNNNIAFTQAEKNILQTELYSQVKFSPNQIDANVLQHMSQLDSSSSLIKSFKNDDWYRIGIQFESNDGLWTNPVFIRDIKCSNPPIVSPYETSIYKQCITMDWPQNPSADFSNITSRFVNYRLVMVETSKNTRRVLAQGIVNPTMFNIIERSDNKPYIVNSWVSRPRGGKAKYLHMQNVCNEDCLTSEPQYDGRSEIQTTHSLYTTGGGIYPVFDTSWTDSYKNEEKLKRGGEYYIDESYLSFNSPEISYSDLTKQNNVKFRIVGVAPIAKEYSDYIIQTDNPKQYTFGQTDRKLFPGPSELLSDYIYFMTFASGGGTPTYNPKMFMWHGSGGELQTLSGLTDNYILNHKIYSNYIQSNYNKYLYEQYEPYISYVNYSVCDGIADIGILDNENEYYYSNYDKVVPAHPLGYKIYNRDSNDLITELSPSTTNSPTRIKFNSCPYAIIGSGYKLLPYLYGNNLYTGIGDNTSIESQWQLSNIYTSLPADWEYYWKTPTGSSVSYSQGIINPNFKTCNNGQISNALDTNIKQYIFIGELYRDITALEAYGSEDSENQKWIPISKSTQIAQNVDLTEGDTYYQKWECLRTYPTTESDENSVVDIVSFMVETHINLDGRCDINRGYTNAINARPTNFGLMNNVYSQTNNIFSYNILDDRFEQNKFPTEFAWSLNKSIASKTDNWSNTSLSNIENVDGKYGKINAIEKLNDTLVCFQDKAICVINFNNRTQISTEQGTPIELANSGKVNGVTYITTNYGCKNKYSIVNAKTGLYFIDDENRALIRIGKDGLADISTSCGMSVWFDKASRYGTLWNGGEINNTSFVLQYDSNRGDIYIMTNGKSEENCIVYNEILGTFTSFFGYKYPLMWNEQGETYCFDNNNNNVVCEKLFGSANYGNDYSIDYRVNPEPLVDKIFTNIEYIADMFNNGVESYDENFENKYSFNKIKCWNEYQEAEGDLTQEQYGASSLQTKFRIRRVDIPRPTTNYGLDRMRNPWIHLKLYKKNSSDTELMEFHSLAVKYFKQ